MTIDAVQLLRKLEPAIRPAGAPALPTTPGTPLEQRSFDDLLTLVSSGKLGEGRPVSVNVALEPPLDDGQRDRLAGAADMAAAAGAGRAVMLIDGRGLLMEVADRAVTGELTAASAEVVPVDAAVLVLGDEPNEIDSESGRSAG